jgi:hypothetical protein
VFIYIDVDLSTFHIFLYEYLSISLLLALILIWLLLHDQSMWILENAIIWKDISYKVGKMHHEIKAFISSYDNVHIICI